MKVLWYSAIIVGWDCSVRNLLLYSPAPLYKDNVCRHDVLQSQQICYYTKLVFSSLELRLGVKSVLRDHGLVMELAFGRKLPEM